MVEPHETRITEGFPALTLLQMLVMTVGNIKDEQSIMRFRWTIIKYINDIEMETDDSTEAIFTGPFLASTE
jgi:hypothetical protein